MKTMIKTTRLGVDKVKPKGWFKYFLQIDQGWLGFGGWVGVVGWVVGPQDFHVILWHFENGASVKVDDVLTEDGGLLHVLALAVHLNFFLMDKQV